MSRNISSNDRYALDVANIVLSKLEESEKLELRQKIFEIFDQWKYEYGVYPKRSSRLVQAVIQMGFGVPDPEQEPAKHYIERERCNALKEGREPKYLKPWDCDNDAKYPVQLLLKLRKCEFAPLEEYLKNVEYNHVVATTIFIEADLDYLSNTCLEAAYELANLQMGDQKAQIEKMTPFVHKVLKQAHQAKASRTAASNKTHQEIIKLHQQFLEKGSTPPYKVYAKVLGLSEATISRAIAKHNLSKQK